MLPTSVRTGASAGVYVMVLYCLMASPATAQQSLPPPTGATHWMGASPVHQQLLRRGDGQVEVAVWVDIPAPDSNGDGPAVSRPPMSVSLVVDTSGSMQGAKIQHARLAARRLIQSLRDGDMVNIVTFSDSARVALPTVRLTQHTRVDAMRQIDRLYASGNTAMYQGLALGLDLLRGSPATHSVRRVFLVSDGHANRGPSHPSALGRLATSALAFDAHVTGIGVGHEYDDRTLGAIVVSSAGRLYHLRHTEMMATIIAEELDALGHTVATNARIEFAAAPGVTVVGGLTMGSRVEAGRFSARIGTLYAGRTAEVMLRAVVMQRDVGVRPLGTARLIYETPDAARTMRVENLPLNVIVTDDATAAAGSLHPRAHAISAAYRIQQRTDLAGQYLARGDSAAAARELEFAAEELDRSARRVQDPAARRRIERRARRVRERRRAAQMSATPAQREHTRRSVLQDAFRDNAF